MRYYIIEGKKYPSVTTILGVLNKPWLLSWKMSLAKSAIIEALLALIEGGKLDRDKALDVETLTDVVEEAMARSEDISKKAMDIGSTIHGAIEFYYKETLQTADDMADLYKTLVEYYDPVVSKCVDKFFHMMDKKKYTVVDSEQTIVGDGYAGTLDLIVRDASGREILLDVKTTTKKMALKFPPFDYKLQLTAYKEPLRKKYPNIRAGVAMLVKDDISKSKILLLKNGEHRKLYKIFLVLRDVFVAQKG